MNWQSRLFDEAADLYDRARPGYPGELIGEVVGWSGIPSGGRILEVGCGTGQATLPFARRGYRVTALEPGPRLAGIAARNLREFPGCRVVNRMLEDWEPEPGAYDLVISATAWHHPARDVKYPRVAAALKPGGALAVFWNMPGEWEAGLRAQFDSAYRRHARPLATASLVWPTERRIGNAALEIVEAGGFSIPAVRRYPWRARYHEAQYLRLLDTYSDHRAMPTDARRNLYGEIAAIIRRRGGAITIPYLAALFLSRQVQ